ncbi:MAG TPA: hypothetical protein VGH95_03995 [Candidatus Aquirickettsiella sp.]
MISDTSLFEANAGMGSLVEREESDLNARVLKIYNQRYHDFNEGGSNVKYPIKRTLVRQTQMPP